MNSDKNIVASNLIQIRDNIKSACERVGRNIDDVNLIAVTKTVDMEIVNNSLDYNITAVAENKVQEIVKKFPNLKKNVQRHMIGHLQRNKVSKVVDKVDIIQSVDSIRLLDEIDKQCCKIDKVLDVLIQVNIGKEENKFGFLEDEVMSAIEHAEKLKHIKVVGLMAMAPFFEDSELTRPYFKKMKAIFDEISNKNYDVEMKILSMGMSGDYVVAIEEGATDVRIGSAIYGKRNYV